MADTETQDPTVEYSGVQTNVEQEDSSDADNETADTKSLHPKHFKIPCKHCNKMISKNNMTTHIKRCKIMLHEAKKVDEHHLLDVIKHLKEQVNLKNEETITLQKELQATQQRLVESDTKFDKLLNQVIIIKRENPAAPSNMVAAPMQIAV